MTRFFSRFAYLFALFTFACAGGPGTATEAEGDAAPGSSNDSNPPYAEPPTGARPSTVATVKADAGTPLISCMVGMALTVLGCGGGDAGTQDLANDSGVLRDSSGSQMIKQDAGPASKDTTMPNDTTLTAADAGSADTSPEVRADAAPLGTTGPKDASGTIGTSDAGGAGGADSSPMGTGGTGGTSGSDGGPQVTVTNALVMNVIMRLKAIPPGVIFLDDAARLHVSGRVAAVGKNCYYGGLFPLFTGPGSPRRGEEAWSPWYGLWTSSLGQFNKSFYRKAVTPITDAELERSFPGVQFKMTLAPLSPKHDFQSFNVISINDWIRANIANLDAAIEAVKPLDLRDCEP